MKQEKIRAGIVGSAGYAGGELLRLLLFHPDVTVHFALSRSHAGKPVTDVHPDLLGETDLQFSGNVIPGADVIFLCLAHGESTHWLEENCPDRDVKIIDLSQDFRIANDHAFVYGLPEWQKEKIRDARRIANPGCFATGIQLALLPLAKAQLLQQDVHITAVTGSTGAGQSLSATSHYTWRYGNHSAYKVLEHQHLAEIGQTIKSLQPDFSGSLHFVPARGTFTRGIHTVAYTSVTLPQNEVEALYAAYYSGHPFVHLCKNAPDVKLAVNTNKCLLHVDMVNDQLVVTSVIDNLLKGAAGTAVQNMNLLFGLPEKSGLQLKPSAY